MASLQEQNHYERLGLSNDADSVVIKRAYRKACLRYVRRPAASTENRSTRACQVLVTWGDNVEPFTSFQRSGWRYYGGRSLRSPQGNEWRVAHGSVVPLSASLHSVASCQNIVKKMRVFAM